MPPDGRGLRRTGADGSALRAAAGPSAAPARGCRRPGGAGGSSSWSRICTPTICTPLAGPARRAPGWSCRAGRGRGAGAAAGGRGPALRVTEVRPGESGGSVAGGVRPRTTGGGCPRTAPGAGARVCGARRGPDVFRGRHRAVRGDGGGGRAVRGGAAAGRRLGAHLGHGHLDAGRAAEAPGPAGGAQRGARALRDVLADRPGPVRPDRFHRPGTEFTVHAARLGLACSVRELQPGETARFVLPDRASRDRPRASGRSLGGGRTSASPSDQ